MSNFCFLCSNIELIKSLLLSAFCNTLLELYCVCLWNVTFALVSKQWTNTQQPSGGTRTSALTGTEFRQPGHSFHCFHQFLFFFFLSAFIGRPWLLNIYTTCYHLYLAVQLYLHYTCINQIWLVVCSDERQQFWYLRTCLQIINSRFVWLALLQIKLLTWSQSSWYCTALNQMSLFFINIIFLSTVM